MFYTYVLRSKIKGDLYTGHTNDLKRRFQEHNDKANFSTRLGAPWQLIYYEACLNETDAKRREKYLKTNNGARLLKRRLKEYFYQLKTNC